MSATSKLLQQALPTTGTSKTTLPGSKKISSTAALLQASGVSPTALAYVPKKPDPIEEEKKARREAGLPVSRSSERAEPTLGGSIIRGVISTPASVVASGKNLVQAVQGKEQTDIKSDYLGTIERVGKGFDVTKGLTASNTAALKDAVGKGLELGSYATGAGITRNALGAVIKPTAKALLTEGAITGAAGGLGIGLQKEDATFGSVLKDTAIGASLGLGTAGLLSAVTRGLGKSASKIVSKADTIPDAVPESVIPTPKTSAQRMADYSKSQGYEPYTPDIELPSIEAGVATKSDLPVIQIGEKKAAKAKGDFIYEPIKEKPTISVPANKPIVTETVNTPTVKKTISYKTIKDEISVLEEANPNIDPTVAKTTFQEQRDLYTKAANENSVNDLIDMSMGRKPLPPGLSKNAVYELTKNRADLTPAQVRRLANTAPESEAGLNLVLTKLREGRIVDNPTDLIKITEKQMKETAKKKVITKNTINRFLDDIECA